MDYKDTYFKIYNEAPPSSIRYEESSADIISVGRGFMGAFDLTMQIQVGCPAGCLYCYVKTGARLTPSSVKGPQGRHWGFVVRDKLDVGNKLRRHIQRGTLANKTIYWSGVTDPYASSPRVTREIWDILNNSTSKLRPKRIAIQTRFRPDRDIHLLRKYSEETIPEDKGPGLVISFSVGTDNNEIIRGWERVSPSFEQRLKAIKKLLKHGLFVVPTLSPFGPWNDLRGTLLRFQELGVPYITVLFFKEKTRSANTTEFFLNHLRKEFPFLLDEVWQEEQLSLAREVFGEKRVLVGQEGFASLANPQDVVPFSRK